MSDDPPPGKSAFFAAAPDRRLLAESGSYELSGFKALLIGPVRFNPGEPFYDLVHAFLVASAGLVAAYDEAGHPNLLDGVAKTYPGKVATDVPWDMGKAVAIARDGAVQHERVEHLLCGMLANAAWERARVLWNETTQLQGAIPQVLRHVRHAASHGNKWNFEGKQPNQPAVWRTLVLEPPVIGSAHPRNGRACFGLDLDAADLLALLDDMQRDLPPPDPGRVARARWLDKQ
jgi:hypothetical protein